MNKNDDKTHKYKVIVMDYNTPAQLIKEGVLRKYQILTQEEHKAILEEYNKDKKRKENYPMNSRVNLSRKNVERYAKNLHVNSKGLSNSKDPRHGTSIAYQKGCRCDSCIAAYKKYVESMKKGKRK